MINLKKERNGINKKMDDPNFAKEYRKEIIREIIQKGVSLQV
jgi:hypothetical protein